MPSEADRDPATAWHRSWKTAAGLGLLPIALNVAASFLLPFADAFAVFVGVGVLGLPLGAAAIVVGLRARPPTARTWRWVGPVALGAAACTFAILMGWTLTSLDNLSNLENLSNL